MEKQECKPHGFGINFRKRNSPRFKAGADLTEKVNVQVELDETEDEGFQSATLVMKVHSDEKETFEMKLERSKRSRFKAGTELTSKVNVLDVDWNQQVSDTEEVMTIGIQLKCTCCPDE